MTPILLGVIPFGMIYGALAISTHLGMVMSQALSSIVFAGSAQFIAVQLIGAGASGVVVLMVVFVVNLRHTLYSASIAPHFRHLPVRWKLLLSYLLTDEAYAVSITRYQREGASPLRHWYFLGVGLALWASWQASTAVGIFIGALLPASWPLSFALPLSFIALVVPGLKDRAMIGAAAVAGVLGVVAAPLPYKLGLMVAALGGIAAGMLLDGRKS